MAQQFGIVQVLETADGREFVVPVTHSELYLVCFALSLLYSLAETCILVHQPSSDTNRVEKRGMKGICTEPHERSHRHSGMNPFLSTQYQPSVSLYRTVVSGIVWPPIE